MAQTDIPQKTKVIMIILALFMPVFLVLPFFFWGGSNDEITINKKLQAERLAPVGQLTVTEPPPPAPEAPAADASATAATETPTADAAAPTADAPAVAAAGGSSAPRDPSFNPKGEYDKICASCHAIGLLNAPKFGDTAAWQARLDKAGGVDGVVQQGIKGINAMPPKGGSTINDDQFHDLVAYILKESKVGQDGGSVAPATEGNSEIPATPENKTETPTADASATAATEAPAADAAAAPAGDSAAPAADAPAVAAAGGSSAPRDPSFNPKGEYDKICASCHAIGLLNAPKFGDTAAWQERLDKAGGVDGVVQQGIKGINAMPPKGGSTINDDQFHDLVVYLLDEAKVAH